MNFFAILFSLFLHALIVELSYAMENNTVVTKKLILTHDVYMSDLVNSFCNNVLEGDIEKLKAFSEQEMVDCVDQAFEIALTNAAYYGMFDMICFLLAQTHFKMSNLNATVLRAAIMGHDEKKGKNNLQIIKELINRGVIITPYCNELVNLPRMSLIKQYFIELNGIATAKAEPKKRPESLYR